MVDQPLRSLGCKTFPHLHWIPHNHLRGNMSTKVVLFSIWVEYLQAESFAKKFNPPLTDLENFSLVQVLPFDQPEINPYIITSSFVMDNMGKDWESFILPL